MVVTPSFIHLRLHSDYSLLESTLKLKAIIEHVTEEKMPAVAVTDHNNLFGALEFSQFATKKGVQPIIGVDLLIERPTFADSKSLEKEYDTLVLLVKNQQGYQNLIKLVSQAHLDVDPSQPPHITFQQLEKYHAGLICLSASIKGAISKLINEDHLDAAEHYIDQLKSLFGDRFYLELTRQGSAEEVKAEPKLLDFAIKKSLPIVATNPTYFSTPSMHEAHTVLMSIADGTYIASEDKRVVSPESYFKSADQMHQLFEDLPEALTNTVQIAKRCAFHVETADPMLPHFESPSGLSEAEEMRKQCYEGLEIRLENQVYTDTHTAAEKDKLKTTYEDRLEHELKIINQMGFDGYFLIVADFIQWAKKQNIPVGPGRGSGAGSLAAWSLTITDIDPIRFNLLFERFLNPERVSMPDFDIDFCQDRRDEVIQYVKEKYGGDQVAQIITFGKLQARAVVRDVGRVLQMPYGQVDRICKMIPNNPADPVTLQEALDKDPVLRRMAKNEPEVQKLLATALKLEGLYRHASTHAAGIIIGDRPLSDVIPLYRDPKSDMAVTQFSFKLVEQAGLVKFDFLGLKTLSIIEKAADFVRKKENPNFNISQLPLDDAKTYEMLKNVQTMGVFQLESAGMRDVLQKLAPDRFEEITTLVALYRPGPMDDIPRYLACKHGHEEIHIPDPMIRDILESSFGVMVYQEQVMQIAQKMGGYSLGAADLLRRAMGKKIKSEMDAQREIFVAGAIKNKVSAEVANQVFDQMAKFAGYGFNKSHSAPYALLAYQTAYLKANYPVEFMTALMTYDHANTDKLTIYRQECQSMGIEVLPPCINHSEVMFSVEGDKIRYALAAIKGVGEQAVDELVTNRATDGPFKSIWDFASRLSGKVMNKRLIEKLIMAGGFDAIEPNRRLLFDNLETILEYATTQRNAREKKTASLFASQSTSVPVPDLSLTKPWDQTEKLHNEHEALGLYLSSHPVQSFRSLFLNALTSQDIKNSTDKIIQLLGVVMAKQVRTGKNGKKFAFLTLTDEFGTFEPALFGDAFYQNADSIEPGMLVKLSAKVRASDGGANRLIVESISDVTQSEIKPLQKIQITCGEDTDWQALKESLVPYVDEENGLDPELIITTSSNAYRGKLGLKIKAQAEDLERIRNLIGIKNLVMH
jgi:DNA polymerase-3 subunit alpha